MFNFTSETAFLRLLAGGLLAGMVGFGLALLPLGDAEGAPAPKKAGAAKAAAKIPNFAPDSGVGWLAAGTEFIALPDGPHPVTNDKAYPYVPNGRGEQPTFRVAEIDNPILLPWVKDTLKRINGRVL